MDMFWMVFSTLLRPRTINKKEEDWNVCPILLYINNVLQYYTPGAGGTCAPFFFPLTAKKTMVPMIISSNGIPISGR